MGTDGYFCIPTIPARREGIDMERLTVPDTYIDGGVRRAVIDARAVKQEAMTLYWALKKYEDTGLTPEEIIEKRVFQEWIPVEESLPDINTDVLVAVNDFGEGTFRDVDYLTNESGKLMWGTYCGAKERVLAWMPLPKRYKEKK